MVTYCINTTGITHIKIVIETVSLNGINRRRSLFCDDKYGFPSIKFTNVSLQSLKA